METINFASNKVGTTILCDKVSADGYDASNLLNECNFSFFSSSENHGFVAANCVYPPVNITFSFPHKICLERIIINTKLNGLQTTSFEIYSCHFQNHKHNFNAQNSSFRQIGRAASKETHIFSFYNSLYGNLKREGDLPLTHQYHQFLNSICALTIRLTQSLNKTSFCISSVKIFGKSVYSTIQKSIPTESLLTNTNIDSPKTKISNLQLVESNPKSDTSDMNIIPSEFYDLITHDIMKRPILLPSGHSIDQSTLDKHILEESKWGRKPSDPFTNIPFGNLLNPIINMPLKLRIDDYILKNKDKLLDNHNTLSSTVSSIKLGYKPSIRSSQLVSRDSISIQKSLKRKPDNSNETSSNKIKIFNGIKWEENEKLIYRHNIPNSFYFSNEETYRCAECDKIVDSGDIIYKACCHLMCQNCILIINKSGAKKLSNCKSCSNVLNGKDIYRIQLEI